MQAHVRRRHARLLRMPVPNFMQPRLQTQFPRKGPGSYMHVHIERFLAFITRILYCFELASLHYNFNLKVLWQC